MGKSNKNLEQSESHLGESDEQITPIENAPSEEKTLSEENAPSEEKVLVKFVKSPIAFNYSNEIGDETEINISDVDLLLEAGVIELC